MSGRAVTRPGGGAPPSPAPPRPQPVPGRPRLAAGVRLVGPMTESAYQEPPWLIGRDGVGSLQVSPLLYRIAELCDGEHSPADIAREITEGGEPVKPETIERNLAGLLVPSGVVV